MITKEERIQLKKILGNNYSSGVLKILEQKKLKNRNNKPYTDGSIRNVMSGKQENQDIEAAIFAHAHVVKKQKEELEANRKELLEE